MTNEQIQGALAQVLEQIQRMSGRECPGISPSTIPLGGLPGFDSNNGKEATALLAHVLGVKLPVDVNLFLDPTGTKALTVSEIAGRVKTVSRTEGPK